MHTMVEIVKNLLVIIILASFLELLLPSGTMKPFVRLAIGLFVLIAVLNPTMRLLFPEEALQISSWEWSHYGEGQEEILERGSELHQKIIAESNQNMKTKLEGQISAIAMLVPGVDAVDSKILLNEDGSIRKVTLNVSGHDERSTGESSLNVFSDPDEPIGPGVESRMAEIMKNMFGLSAQQIEIQMQGGP